MTDESVDRLLEIFFGPGNELDPELLLQSSPELGAWLSDRLQLLREEPSAAHILPRRLRGQTTWYGLAHSARQARGLEQELQAFVGSSYAKVDRQPPLDPSDDVEAAVLDFTSGNAMTFEVLVGAQADVRRSLEVLSDLHRIRPLREPSLARPLGRLLRDFEMAVASGDEELSKAALEEIEQSGALSTQNIVFLRVRRLGGLNRFDELLALPELGPLLTIDRPTRVTAELFRAVYVTQLASFEETSDPQGAVDHFNDEVLRRLPGLYKSRHGIATPEAIKSFVLHAVALAPDDSGLIEELLEAPDLTETDRAWVTAVAELANTRTAQEPLYSDAADAIRLGQFDAALRIARGLPPGLERTELLVRCAVEIDSLDAVALAFDAVGELPSAQREALIASRWYAAPWAHIQEVVGRGPEADAEEPESSRPSSWAELFEHIVDRPSAGTVLQFAERGVVEWSIEEFSSSDEPSRISHALGRSTDETSRHLRDVLPHFLQFLDRGDDTTSTTDLIGDLAVLLLSEDTLRPADMQVTVNIIATLLELGLTAERYSSLVGDFLALWARTEAPSHLEVAIEMLDVLLLLPSPDPNARHLMFQAVLTSFQRWRRRVRQDQWALLFELAEELGAGEAVQAVRGVAELEDDQADEAARMRLALAGKTVAIYTLTEPAALRARDFITKSFADVRVEIAHDHVASDRLRGLAHTSDLFVVATRSAKHAATTFIQAQRPPALPILFPAGKGSASIIRSIFGHLRDAGV